MVYDMMSWASNMMPGWAAGSAILLVLAMLWTLPWKGVALWKSAKKNQLVWFIVFLIVNTLGILEILYIFIFSKMGEKKSKRRR